MKDASRQPPEISKSFKKNPVPFAVNHMSNDFLIASCKPALERSMTEISELGFLWMNISKFDSVTNDSVKEIFLPVDYDEKIFKDI